MKPVRAILVATLLAATLLASGCKKKKPPVPPPQASAPTVTEPAPQPAAPAETKPEPEVTPPAPAPEPTVEKPKVKSKPKPRTHVAKKEPVPVKEPAKPPRTVVPEGSAPSSGGQLSATIPDEAATHQRFNTAQLLEATDYNLKNITRTLSADEQAMVQHIRSYMAQSREATQQGDTQRAYNLALKAHLLSDEIVKR